MVEIGVKLAHVIWRKVASDERDAADSDINQICYELILNQEYKLAAEILCFASEDVFSKHSTAERRLAFQFNLAQCYKWIGNETACRNIIEKVDCSALDMRFQICHAVLRDDFNTALRVFNATGTSGSLTKEDYETWPIFNKLRERPEFLEAFRVLFGQELRKLKDFEIKLEREIQREFVPQPHPALPADESTPADLRSPG
jgi:hypothetical protein